MQVAALVEVTAARFRGERVRVRGWKEGEREGVREGDKPDQRSLIGNCTKVASCVFKPASPLAHEPHRLFQ